MIRAIARISQDLWLRMEIGNHVIYRSTTKDKAGTHQSITAQDPTQVRSAGIF